jgi:GrpB-like predicted nucleotidyltransferase (UPF0157 family)
MTGFALRFSSERARLLAALGAVTGGGLVEGLQHVASIRVPGLDNSGVVGIALSVWPFPLAEESLAALRALGYRPLPGFEAAPEQRFRHRRRPVQLLVVEAGSQRSQNFISLRDYLASHTASVRPSQAAAKAHHFVRLLPRADAR